MPKIRVLIVDDSVVVRRIVGDILAQDPDIQVVGTAPNGKIAVAKIPQVNPDIITMDVEMPEMDGIQTVCEIRKTHPRLPIIMFSTLTARGAISTLDALAAGANDYVTKPANVGCVVAARQRIMEQLIPKIKGFCTRSDLPLSLPARSTMPGLKYSSTARSIVDPFATSKPLEILAIGVSTGGPNALAELLPALPENFPLPIVIVQHMPPLFTKMLAERLNAQSKIRVYEGAAGDRIRRGGAWIAPGDYHMTVRRDALTGALDLSQGSPENSCRPAVDVLFRSVVKSYGSGTLAVVLTGMGRDGLHGCTAVREAGGQVVVQDEASSVVWGMPGFVARAGLADRILPLSEIASELVRRAMIGKSVTTATGLRSSGDRGTQSLDSRRD